MFDENEDDERWRNLILFNLPVTDKEISEIPTWTIVLPILIIIICLAGCLCA